MIMNLSLVMESVLMFLLALLAVGIPIAATLLRLS
jgi:hypothetical protein